MNRPLLLWDFDNTLLRTWLYTKFILTDLAAHLDRSVDDLYRLADKMEERYSLDGLLQVLGLNDQQRTQYTRTALERTRTNGGAFLFPGVDAVVRACAVRYEQGLITRGVESNQRQKFSSTPILHTALALRHFVDPNGSKGELIQATYSDRVVTVVDDNANELLDILARCPQVRCIRMAWPERNPPPHPDDNREWPVARSTDELLAILLTN